MYIWESKRGVGQGLLQILVERADKMNGRRSSDKAGRKRYPRYNGSFVNTRRRSYVVCRTGLDSTLDVQRGVETEETAVSDLLPDWPLDDCELLPAVRHQSPCLFATALVP